jgi:hypothetical protein
MRHTPFTLSATGIALSLLFDRKVSHLLRDEYRIKQVTKVTAETIEDLVRKLEDVNADAALDEIRTFNDSVNTSMPFNPNIKDGRSARSSAIPSRTGPIESMSRRSKPMR